MVAIPGILETGRDSVELMPAEFNKNFTIQF